MEVDLSFWNSTSVFVTGHTGFKGSWISLWLRRLGADVIGYSLNVPTTPSLFELARVENEVRSVQGDVLDLPRLRRTIAEHRPELVIHMAAQALVRRSYVRPLETYATNVLGTAHVLESVRDAGSVRAVIVVTSDKCYAANEHDRPHREDDPLGGNDPYSTSKAAAELVTGGYRAALVGRGTIAVASVRAGNVIGGGDWAQDRLVPDLVRGAMDARSVAIRNPDALRPWQHVLNPLLGYLMLAERLGYEPSLASAWNFGPDDLDERPVRWIASRVAERWGPGLEWCEDNAEQPPEAPVLRLDSAKARVMLGWHPRWDLERGLEETVAWYRAVTDGADPRALTLAQIDAYMDASVGAEANA